MMFHELQNQKSKEVSPSPPKTQFTNINIQKNMFLNERNKEGNTISAACAFYKNMYKASCLLKKSHLFHEKS